MFFRTWKILILRGTKSIFNAFSYDILQPRYIYKEFRATFHFFFIQRASKLRGGTGGTIRTIIVAVRARKSKSFRSPIRLWGICFLNRLFRDFELQKP